MARETGCQQERWGISRGDRVSAGDGVFTGEMGVSKRVGRWGVSREMGCQQER